MSSRIEQLIDEIEEYIDGCKPKFMSNSEIVVNKDEIDELLRELRMKTPDEIKRYQKIISNKEAIINDARQKAQALIDDATAQTTQLVSEHEIMQQAYAQANEVVTMATRQAQEILDKATNEANALREAAVSYMDDMLNNIEDVLSGSAQAAVNNYESLISNLNYYKETVQSNRNELHPAIEDVPGESPSNSDKDEDIDVI